MIDYLQNLRVEHAKRLLESAQDTIDEIIADTGYEDPAFFRRLFKRTGLTPSQYRRMFQPVIHAAGCSTQSAEDGRVAATGSSRTTDRGS